MHTCIGFTTPALQGQPEPIKDQDQTNYFTLLTGELDKETYSNFLSYNALGQATGLALKEDQKSNEKLKFLKSSTILGFLKNKVGNDLFQNTPTKNGPKHSKNCSKRCKTAQANPKQSKT